VKRRQQQAAKGAEKFLIAVFFLKANVLIYS
jgi:hypothetical protein